jgi:hypothetical protein
VISRTQTENFVAFSMATDAGDRGFKAKARPGKGRQQIPFRFSDFS